ncbi:MAG TPA: peptide-methionine (R)-S-oxide reductase MsrB [Candidatus Cybelea sp.]|jgi:peptide-methionine (R)-S-oxide reductase|nr:peptide-methionine (R)-S-oxide reductase MsrB [Candidatus Cybelea sp.]
MRRGEFLTAAATLAFAGCAVRGSAAQQAEVTHTDAQWRAILGPDRYYVLRQNGTELAFSSALIAEKRSGTYYCAGCQLALFSSKTKYDSGDGWPSFWNVLPNATRTRSDFQLVAERTEVHCRKCDGHLGHIFDDGPAPTHLRYCIDGLALRFVAA